MGRGGGRRAGRRPSAPPTEEAARHRCAGGHGTARAHVGLRPERIAVGRTAAELCIGRLQSSHSALPTPFESSALDGLPILSSSDARLWPSSFARAVSVAMPAGSKEATELALFLQAAARTDNYGQGLVNRGARPVRSHPAAWHLEHSSWRTFQRSVGGNILLQQRELAPRWVPPASGLLAAGTSSRSALPMVPNSGNLGRTEAGGQRIVGSW